MYILKALGFKIQYPTLETWGNYMTVKWDEFANMENLKLINQVKFPKFRHDSQYDYMLFRQFFLIFDVISLDYYHQFFNEKAQGKFVIVSVVVSNHQKDAITDSLEAQKEQLDKDLEESKINIISEKNLENKL